MQPGYLRRERGSAAIEFALLLPVLLLFVGGIIEFSLLMFATGVIDNAASSAARFGITGNDYGSGSRDAYVLQTIRDLSAGFVDADEVRISTVVHDDFRTPDSGEDNGNFTPGCGGQAVTYTVSYDWEFLFPRVAKVIRPDGEPYTISASVLVKNEEFGGCP